MKIQSTIITIDRMRFYAYHGVIAQEKTVGGEYTVSLRLTLNDASAAIERDQLQGTVNYAEVYELVKKEMQQTSELLEHVAGRILEKLFAAFSLVEVAEIEVRKNNPPMGADCDGAAVLLRASR